MSASAAQVRCVVCLLVEYASRASRKCDGLFVVDRNIAVSLPQSRGRTWRLEDEEQAENIALDPQRRSMIMRHMAESKKDEELTRMMDQVSNPGRVAVNVGEGRVIQYRTWVRITSP